MHFDPDEMRSTHTHIMQRRFRFVIARNKIYVLHLFTLHLIFTATTVWKQWSEIFEHAQIGNIWMQEHSDERDTYMNMNIEMTKDRCIERWNNQNYVARSWTCNGMNGNNNAKLISITETEFAPFLRRRLWHKY